LREGFAMHQRGTLHGCVLRCRSARCRDLALARRRGSIGVLAAEGRRLDGTGDDRLDQ